MNVTAIVQARMGSTRLPGKVLQNVAGQTVLGRTVRRLQRAGRFAVIVATTVDLRDDDVAAEAETLGVGVFRGSELDVLDRYVRAAEWCGADAVIRVTADCPLIDHDVVSRVLDEFISAPGGADYCSNTLRRTFPRGLDTEVITTDALIRAWESASQAHEREHVTPYVWQHPQRFRIVSVTNAVDYSHLRWTVDVEDDLLFVRAVYERLGADGAFGWNDVLALVRAVPDIAAINAHVAQKSITAS